MSIFNAICMGLLGLVLLFLGLTLVVMLCCMAGDFNYYSWEEHKRYPAYKPDERC